MTPNYNSFRCRLHKSFPPTATILRAPNTAKKPTSKWIPHHVPNSNMQFAGMVRLVRSAVHDRMCQERPPSSMIRIMNGKKTSYSGRQLLACKPPSYKTERV